MSDLRPISHWGLWMRMHEPTGLSMRQHFLVHFWANWEMLKQPRDLAISSLVALIPSGTLATAVWLARPHRRGSVLHGLANDQTVLLLVVVGQGAIGYTQYFNRFPAGLVLLHVTGSVAFWLSVLWVREATWAPARGQAGATTPARGDAVPVGG